MNVRLNFLVRTETRDLFVRLRDRVRLGSITEVLRRSLRAYDLITRAVLAGHPIIVVEPTGERRTVDFPELPRP